MESATQLVLVTGLQGTGKSTVADGVADALGAPVFAWDWFMGALTPFDAVQATLRSLDGPTHRAIGWALMLQTARAQLRRGLPVVLDGLARDDEIRAARSVAREFGIESHVILTTCADTRVQRARIEERSRGIPGWHELSWDDVERTRASWTRPADVDIELDTMLPAADVIATAIGAIRR